MKILFLTRSFYPNIGGVEKHILEVSKRLVALGHTVTVIAEKNITAQSDYQSKELSAKNTVPHLGIRIYRIPVTVSEKGKKYQIWRWLYQHRTLLQDTDIVHCHDVFYWYLPFKILYPTKKVFTTFHGYETNYPPRKNAVHLRRISKRLSSGTINVGEYIRKWYGTRSDITTYGGVSQQKVLDEVKKFSGKLRILFVGRIEEDNGVAVYSEVLNILDNNKIGYTFEALGDGSLRKAFERFGKVHGFVKQLDRYIKEADIIFASSYLSILEAFKYKKYVISVYQNPLKRDYLLMTPFKKWIFASDEAMELAHEVIAISRDHKKLASKQDEAHEWVLKQTWEHLTDQYLTLWHL